MRVPLQGWRQVSARVKFVDQRLVQIGRTLERGLDNAPFASTNSPVGYRFLVLARMRGQQADGDAFAAIDDAEATRIILTVIIRTLFQFRILFEPISLKRK